MDQINEILASLSDEDMDSLKTLANSLLGSDFSENDNGDNSPSDCSFDDYNNPFSSLDPAMIAKIGMIISKLNSKKDDDRVRLIMALKPMLSDKRKARADEAIKMMSLFEILPELKNLNIL